MQQFDEILEDLSEIDRELGKQAAKIDVRVAFLRRLRDHLGLRFDVADEVKSMTRKIGKGKRR